MLVPGSQHSRNQARENKVKYEISALTKTGVVVVQSRYIQHQSNDTTQHIYTEIACAVVVNE